MANIKQKPLILLATGSDQLNKALRQFPSLADKFTFADRTCTYREGVIETVDDVKPNKLIIFDLLKSQAPSKESELSLTGLFQELKMDETIRNENIVFVSTQYAPGDSILSNIVQKGFFNVIAAKNMGNLPIEYIIKLLVHPNDASDVNDLVPEAEIPDDKSSIQYRVPTSPKTKIVYVDHGRGDDLSDTSASELDHQKSVKEQAEEASRKFNKKEIDQRQARPKSDIDAAKVADKMGKKASSDNASAWEQYQDGDLPGEVIATGEKKDPVLYGSDDVLSVTAKQCPFTIKAMIN